ncbi:MAG: ABC transporter permease subunit, partial [Pseudomonadota bacterium]
IFLLLGLALFVIFAGISLAVSGMKPQKFADVSFGDWLLGILDEVHRREGLSQGRTYDRAIKDFLSLDAVTSVTEAIRYVVNVYILIPTERALLYVPTPAVILAVSALAYRLGGRTPAILGFLFFFAVAQLGYWDRAMLTLHSVFMAVLLAVIIGAPFAVFASRSEKRARRTILLCDTLQTFPSYVYLLPAVMLFGISPVTVILSILIYTMVPVVRYTLEGLRGVPAELTEAADMSGATRWQKLREVQIPLAMPTIAVGINQALVFAFFMVIIAEFIGTRDLGQEMRRTMAGTEIGWNFVLGFSVVFMALTFDIAINAWAEKRRKLLGLA